MTELLSIAEAYPQLGMGLGIAVAAVLLALVIHKRIKGRDETPAEVLQQVNKLVLALTDKNGDPLPPVKRLEKIETTLASHGKMHKKQFAAIGRLQDGQNEVLEYLTNGTASKRPKVNYNIDAEDTGRFEAVGE